MPKLLNAFYTAISGGGREFLKKKKGGVINVIIVKKKKSLESFDFQEQGLKWHYQSINYCPSALSLSFYFSSHLELSDFHLVTAQIRIKFCLNLRTKSKIYSSIISSFLKKG